MFVFVCIFILIKDDCKEKNETKSIILNLTA